ncbi:MAG: NAD-dependent epimerase/dehydratase family protein [Myxococcota bacterium]
MKVLVTGANGFVGSHVARALLDGGHDVAACVREGADLARHRAMGLSDRLRYVHADLGAVDEVERVLDEAEPQAIVHCAAFGATGTGDARAAARVNVVGTLDLYEAAKARGCARFVYFDTAYVYGPGRRPWTESDPVRPRGVYGASKAAAFLMLREAAAGDEHPPLVLRLFNLFGEHDDERRLVPQVVRAALERKPLALSAGTQRRDFVYVGDVARTVEGLLSLPGGAFPAGEVFNVCSGRPRPIRELVLEIARALDGERWMEFGEVQHGGGRGADLTGDCSRLRVFCEEHDIPGVARPTSLEDAVAAMADAMRAGRG